MTKKLYIKTFGCQMNEYDSDKMADVLRASEGMEQTETPEDADVILSTLVRCARKRRRRCSPISGGCVR